MTTWVYNMEWNENPLVWQNLDRLAEEAWPALKELLDTLADHREEIPDIAKALLFAGLGRFFAAYRHERAQANTPEQSMVEALRQVYGDNRIQGLMQQAVNDKVDAAVGGLIDG